MSDATAVVPRGRYAPSPTGFIHLGNARTALVAWLSVRAQGGHFLWRLEDLDGPRVVAGMAEAAIEDLRWLGLDWDEGPDVGGPHEPYEQGARSTLYEAAIDHLYTAGRVFPCQVSRKELQTIASAPHGHEGLPPYPPDLRPAALSPDWLATLRAAANPDAAIRFRVEEGPVTFHDLLQGACTEDVQTEVGDFVLKRRDGLYAYQLAVVVDDLAMGVTEVVRGEDLLASTARQVQLIEALGGTPPAYAHVPLVLNAEGKKLSKRDDGLALRELRAARARPEQVAGYLGYSLGLLDAPHPCTAADLVPRFGWARIPRTPWALPDDLATTLPHLA